MENKLKELRSSMNQTVLKNGSLNSAEKHRILENVLNGHVSKKNNFIAPILSVALSLVFMFSIGSYTYYNLFPDTRHSDISPPDTTMSESVDRKIKVETALEEKESAKEDNDKKWKDVTVLEQGTKYDMATNAKDYIASANRSIHQIPAPDSKLIQRGYDEMYFYYLEASAIQNGLNIIAVEGIDIEKDFDNLYNLTMIIYEEQGKRTDGVNLDGVNKFDAHKYWKEPTDEMKLALDYLQKLLNDLDIAINEEGIGQDNGYSYQGDGDKTEELQAFIDSYFGF
ncbi:hypothetical protein [Mesobacillus selenatarsenatis]|uniref:Uncharacterized protein n=1 Tax=Mesobacillus selenatarsenatis (strain DSM 18680 / JCM 14380 / FERM P-15431 / SF-1) TaxID=1321606 RepID=A0A0A8X3E1_MESS1|nr:hypothetical protein [Mesobacillus selenatarsenatis]GAM14485.1 hypothetical protein SAMD00020551_2636 [Mesobacillus selenatarsenatis SF-1]